MLLGHRTLSNCDSRRRIVLRLRDVVELAIDEMVEALALSVVAVEAPLFRASLQLRDKLSNHFATGGEHSELSGQSIRRPLNMDLDNLMTSFLQSALRERIQ